MDRERRQDTKPVPENLENILNEAQIRTLRSIRHFGWELHFVRRPMFQEVVPVLVNREGDKFIVLHENGAINEVPDLDLRDCTPAPELMKKIVNG
jgi:hypothetical protein